MFQAAERFAELGLRSDAIDAVKKAILADPAHSPGASVRAIVDDVFGEALALAAAGFDEQAATLAKQQLQQHPYRTLPPQLTYLNGQLLRDAQPVQNVQTRSAIAFQDVLLVAVALLVIFLILVPIFGRVFTTRVQVKSFDEEKVTDGQELGKTLAVIVEDELRRLKSEGGSSSLSVTRTPDAALPLPDAVKELPGQAGLVLTLLGLVPNRLFVISGTLHPKGERGVGLTVAIADPSGTITASESFWESDYDPDFGAKVELPEVPVVAAYRRLALAAASWAIYQPPLVPEGDPPSGYVSAVWRSYALHRVAVSWQDADDEGRATRLYQQALDRDPANFASLLNLACLQKTNQETDRETAKERRKRAVELLREGKRLTETQPDRDVADRSWYRIRFNLGLFLVEATLRDHPSVIDRAAWLADAERCAIAVVSRSDSDSPRADAAGLRTFLRTIRDSAVALLAGTWQLMGPGTAIPPDCTPLPEPFARAVSGTRAANVLIDKLVEERGGFEALPPNVRYDLASYFSLAGDFDRALTELSYGVRTAEEAEEATSDPALVALERARPDDFRAVLIRWAGRAEKPKRLVLWVVRSRALVWSGRNWPTRSARAASTLSKSCICGLELRRSVRSSPRISTSLLIWSNAGRFSFGYASSTATRSISALQSFSTRLESKTVTHL